MRSLVKPEYASLAAAAILIVQAFAVHGAAGLERMPPAPDLARFPRQLGTWQSLGEIAISPGVARELGADRILERQYLRRPDGAFVDLFVAWFQSQRGGATQPHSPKVCLPGSGWLPIDSRQIPLENTRGTIGVNQYVVKNSGRRATVIYWYQTPHRVIAGEWAAKFFTLADGLRDRRTDTAVIRIFVPARPDGKETRAATDFAAALYPALSDALPK